MLQTIAIAYCRSLIGVIGFQVALIFGAPWGRLTQGGTHEGALPASGRVAAAVSILMLIGMGLAFLSQAGLSPNWPRWTGWTALAVQAMSALANWATRSAPERKLWAPITTALFLMSSTVMALS